MRAGLWGFAAGCDRFQGNTLLALHLGCGQSVPGTVPMLVNSEQDRTAMTLSGSVTFTRTEHSLSLV